MSPKDESNLPNREESQPSVAQTQPPAPASVQSAQYYRVFSAIRDTLSAMKYNAAAYFGSVLLVVLLAVAVVMVMVVLLGLAGLGTEMNSTMPFATQLILLLIVAGILYAIWSAVAGAFTSVSALAVRDGAQRRKSSVAKLLSAASKQILRVTGANILFGLIAVVPPILALMVLVFLDISGALNISDAFNIRRPDPSANLSVIACGIASFVWILFCVLRYGLMPYVAVFEPKVPITQTMARSRALLAGGGGRFLTKSLLLLLLTMNVASILSGADTINPSAASNTISTILSVLVSLIWVGMLTMLYWNRKHVVGEPEAPVVTDSAA